MSEADSATTLYDNQPKPKPSSSHCLLGHMIQKKKWVQNGYDLNAYTIRVHKSTPFYHMKWTPLLPIHPSCRNDRFWSCWGRYVEYAQVYYHQNKLTVDWILGFFVGSLWIMVYAFGICHQSTNVTLNPSYKWYWYSEWYRYLNGKLRHCTSSVSKHQIHIVILLGTAWKTRPWKVLCQSTWGFSSILSI